MRKGKRQKSKKKLPGMQTLLVSKLLATKLFTSWILSQSNCFYIKLDYKIPNLLYLKMGYRQLYEGIT